MSNKPVRSPSYPNLSLSDAVDAVKKIERKYRSAAVARTDAAKLIGFAGLSGPANQALAALAAYGLLERAGRGDTRVTERARAILHPESSAEQLENLNAAAWAPTLFQNLRERFSGVPVPPEDGVLTYLNREGFNPNSVRRAAQAFLRTAKYMQEQRASAHNGQEPSDPEESSGESSGGPGSEESVVRPGDWVQWESQGVLQFSKPLRVRAVSDDGDWAFVEGSETGLPMAELSVERKGVQPVRPMLPLDDRGEVEWLRIRVGTNTSVRLLVTGNVGSKEVERLIRVLTTQRAVLLEDETGVELEDGERQYGEEVTGRPQRRKTSD